MFIQLKFKITTQIFKRNICRGDVINKQIGQNLYTFFVRVSRKRSYLIQLEKGVEIITSSFIN